MSRMYKDTKTWNVFKGCLYDCAYCRPSFQRQARRIGKRCLDCYNYQPHEHPERLTQIPNAKIVFVAGNGDLAFATRSFRQKIYAAMRDHAHGHPDTVYYLQSKNPAIFTGEEIDWPEHTWIGTTIETNRDTQPYSKAPRTIERIVALNGIDWPNKYVTIEPLMDMDVPMVMSWLTTTGIKRVYIGYNSKPKEAPLPEPTEDEVTALIRQVRQHGIELIPKDLRGIKMEECL